MAQQGGTLGKDANGGLEGPRWMAPVTPHTVHRYHRPTRPVLVPPWPPSDKNWWIASAPPQQAKPIGGKKVLQWGGRLRRMISHKVKQDLSEAVHSRPGRRGQSYP